ncbi:MAG TPA: hypothetical protein VM115_10840 [Vicinamibacterales bacterium]|nr:hypothetical protein [Vicinamibacterales bacterium]
MRMRPGSVFLALLAVAAVSAQPAQGVLRVKVTLASDTQAATPIRRHALLVSDEPPTAEPRQIFTGADGTTMLRLRPGTYVVESDTPVSFGGLAYVWRQEVQIVAGRDLNLDLTADNAEIVPLSMLTPPSDVSGIPEDPLVRTNQESVVTVWSPTAQASGFLVDARGLIATDARAVGTTTVVEVQLSPTLKVPGNVLPSGSSRDVAIIRIDPSVVTARPALARACAPSAAPATALIDGVATVRITVTQICEALAASLPLLSGTAPPSPTPLPVDPTRPYPAGALESTAPGKTPSAAVPVIASSDFDVAFLTPPMVHRGRQRAGWTGGPPSGRSPEAEERLGRLTEFGAWSDYFSSLPAVLVVRATPKMVESFWKRLGREAARTQGAVLPAFKDFESSFQHMRVTCGGVGLTPIHPFVLEHRMNEKNVIREGLYVFDADAIGPHCGTVTVSLYSDQQPDRADTITLTRSLIDRLWNDFAPYR